MQPEIRLINHIVLREEATSHRFHVAAERAGALIPWLDVHRRLMPVIPPDISPERARSKLVLGDFVTKKSDPLFSRIRTEVQVDPRNNAYDLSTTFVPVGADITDFDQPTDVQTIELPQEERNRSQHITLEALQTKSGFGYRIHLRREGLTKENIAAIHVDMNKLALVTEQVWEGFYLENGVESELPNETLVIVPPDNINEVIGEEEAELVALLRISSGFWYDPTRIRYV